MRVAIKFARGSRSGAFLAAVAAVAAVAEMGDREYGSDITSPVRRKPSDSYSSPLLGPQYYGVQGGVFVPAFRAEFGEVVPVPGMPPGDRRLRWSENYSHWLWEFGVNFLPTDPGDRLFSVQWKDEVEHRYQLFVQAIHEDNVPWLQLLDRVNFIDPKLYFPVVPAPQKYAFEEKPSNVDGMHNLNAEYRPYRYSVYCATYHKPRAQVFFENKERSPLHRHTYVATQDNPHPETHPDDYFRPVDSFPGLFPGT